MLSPGALVLLCTTKRTVAFSTPCPKHGRRLSRRTQCFRTSLLAIADEFGPKALRAGDDCALVARAGSQAERTRPYIDCHIVVRVPRTFLEPVTFEAQLGCKRMKFVDRIRDEVAPLLPAPNKLRVVNVDHPQLHLVCK
jgi:hypothetical protein